MIHARPFAVSCLKKIDPLVEEAIRGTGSTEEVRAQFESYGIQKHIYYITYSSTNRRTSLEEILRKWAPQ